MIKTAIIGGSGYTGLELLRILALHDKAMVTAVTSRQYAGKWVTEIFPSLIGHYDEMSFIEPSEIKDVDAELFFCCLPHGTSMQAVPILLKAGKKVIDLSADYRIKEIATYEKWYQTHTSKELIAEAAYGLPEVFGRDEIKEANLIANPGCYPTGAALALAPLVKAGLIKNSSIIIDAKSGVSGAGRTASIASSFVEIAEGFKAYKVGEHRHTPEINQTLGLLAGAEVSVTFTPHLLPIKRGILSTVYADLKETGSHTTASLLEVFRKDYADEPFINICEEGVLPNINEVAGTNNCSIGLKLDSATGRVVVVSVIDNLVKGASGAAIQNMNITYGLGETTGLISISL